MVSGCHRFKSYYAFITAAIDTALNFGNKFDLLPKLRREKIKQISAMIQKSAIIIRRRYKFLRL